MGILDKLRPQSKWKHADPAVRLSSIPDLGDDAQDVLASLLVAPGMQANLVPDAHLAALAIEHGLTLCSTDGDFGRFAALRWRDPLAA